MSKAVKNAKANDNTTKPKPPTDKLRAWLEKMPKAGGEIGSGNWRERPKLKVELDIEYLDMLRMVDLMQHGHGETLDDVASWLIEIGIEKEYAAHVI